MSGHYSYSNAREHLKDVDIVRNIILTEEYKNLDGYKRILQIQCSQLNNLLDDGLLNEALEYCLGGDRRNTALDEAYYLFSDMTRFLDYIKSEEEILRNSGVPDKLSSLIIAKQKTLQATLMLDKIKSFEDFKLSVPSFEQYISVFKELRDQVCDAHKAVNQFADHMNSLKKAEKIELTSIAAITATGNGAFVVKSLGVSLLSLFAASKWAHDASLIKVD
jgi:hypothetical protein